MRVLTPKQKKSKCTNELLTIFIVLLLKLTYLLKTRLPVVLQSSLSRSLG